MRESKKQEENRRSTNAFQVRRLLDNIHTVKADWTRCGSETPSSVFHQELLTERELKKAAEAQRKEEEEEKRQQISSQREEQKRVWREKQEGYSGALHQASSEITGFSSVPEINFFILLPTADFRSMFLHV